MARSHADYELEYAACESEDLVRTGLIQAGFDMVALGPDGNIQTNLGSSDLENGLLDALRSATLGAAVGHSHRWVDAGTHGRWLMHHLEGHQIFERVSPATDDGPKPEMVDCAAIAQSCCENLWKFNYQLCAAVTRAVRCDRAMVYRFHHDYSGEVVAEQVSGELEPFQGLRYPPTDIPRQARAIFERVGARSVFSISRTNDAIGALTSDLKTVIKRPDPLNTEFCVSRAVSPFHIRYLREMGTKGTATCPLLIRGKLWGILSLHFQSERPASCEEFAVLQTLSIEASAVLERLIDKEKKTLVDRGSCYLQQLAEAFDTADQGIATLLSSDMAPHRMVAGDGACLVVGDRICTTGRAPDLPVINALCAMVRDSTDRNIQWLEEMPDTVPATGHNEIAGCAICPLDAGGHGYFIVFRRAQDRKVVWGGDPRRIDRGGALPTDAPLRSFERWVENVQGIAADWGDTDRRILSGTLAILVDWAARQGTDTCTHFEHQIDSLVQDRTDLHTRAERIIDGTSSAIGLATQSDGGDQIRLLSMNRAAVESLEVSTLAARMMTLPQVGAALGLSEEHLGKQSGHVSISTANRGMRDCELRTEQVFAFHDLGDPNAHFCIETHEFLDVTEARRIEQALLAARDRALRQVDLRSEFFAKLSHELRTPLNAIVGISSLLVERSHSLDDKVRRRVKTIYRASDHMSELIDTALSNAECVNALQTHSIENVALSQLVDEVKLILAHGAERIHVQIDNQVPKDMDCKTEPRAMRQLLINLMSNAVKYNVPHGRITVSTGTHRPRFLDLVIADTGIGMSPDEVENCLRPYTRYASGQGSGLGLSITNHLVAAMGGVLSIVSERGRGTSVTVRLPLEPQILPDLSMGQADQPAQLLGF